VRYSNYIPLLFRFIEERSSRNVIVANEFEKKLAVYEKKLLEAAPKWFSLNSFLKMNSTSWNFLKKKPTLPPGVAQQLQH